MFLDRLLPTLRARWGTVLLTCAVAVAVAACISFLLPANYRSSASLLVEKNSADPIQGVALPPGVTSNYVATQADVLRSEEVALRAMRSLGLQEKPEWRERWQEETFGSGSFESWLAGELLRRLDVKPSRDSNVMSLTFDSRDRELSSAVANAFVQAYIDTSLQLRVEPAQRYNAFFDERSQRLRQDLERAQARLSEYQQKHGLIASDERLDVENSRLAQLSYQLIGLQEGAQEAAARARQAAADPRRMQEVLTDPVVAPLTAELSRQEARLSELRTDLGEQHPQILDLRASIGELRNRVAAAVRQASGSVGVTTNVAQGRLQAAQAAYERQRARVMEQKSRRDQADVLLREVENAQRAYDAVLSRAGQTALESLNKQTNVSVLKVATPPSKPLWPRPKLYLTAALVIGFLLGLALALWRERVDRRLRSADDVPLWLEQPLLRTLRDSSTERGRGARSEQAMERLVRVLPLPNLARP